MSKVRHIRDEGHVRILLRQGGWIEAGRVTKKVCVVRDKNDPGDLIDPIIFDRLEKAGLLKRNKASPGLQTWGASSSLLASEKPS